METGTFYTQNWIALVGLLIALLAFLRIDATFIFKKIFCKMFFYPTKQIEIGFYDFGPTLGLNGTLRAIGGDQFVTEITAKINRKKDNAEFKYTWGFFRSTYDIYNRHNQGQESSVKVDIAAPFILSNNISRVYNIQYHDTVTKERYLSPLIRLKDNFQKLITDQKITDTQKIDALRLSFYEKNLNEINNIKKKLQDEFYWKEGNYIVDVEIHTDRPNNKFKYSYEFRISQEQVNILEENIDGLIFYALQGSHLPQFILCEITHTN